MNTSKHTFSHFTKSDQDRFFDLSVDMLALASPDGFFTKANHAFEKTLGYTRDELLSRPFINLVHPEDRARTLKALLQATKQTILDFENRYRCKDGSYRWVQWRTVPSPTGDLVYAIARDITEKKQMDELQLFQSQILADIAIGKPHEEILDHICQGIEALVPRSLTSLMLLHKESNQLHITAPRKLPNNVCVALNGLVPGPQAGSCGTSAYLGKPVIVTDTSTDPRWTALQSFAKDFGIKSCWSIPILGKKQQVLGTFAISHTQSAFPSKFHWKLLEVASHISGIALQRHHTEQALRESEERLRTIFDHAPLGLSIVDPQGHFLETNPTLEAFLGYAPLELLGKEFSHVTHQEDQVQNAPLFRELVNGERDFFSMEKRYLRKDGSVAWGEVSMSALRHSDGSFNFSIAMIKDIQLRKEAEMALRQSEERFRLLAEVMPQQVWTATPDGALDYVNQRVLDFFDRTNENILGWGWQDVIHPGELSECLRRWKNARESGTPFEIKFRLLRASDHTYHWHIGRAIPVHDSDGQIIKWFGTNTDISDIEQTKEALRTANGRLQALSKKLLETQERERRHLAHDLHDEIGQTLTALKMNFQTLNREQSFPHLPGLIPDSIEILDSMLTHIRELSLDLRPSMLDDLGLVSAVRWLIKRQAERANWNTNVYIDTELPPLSPEHATASYRVIQEALTNAMRHAHASSVTVQIRQINDELEIVIKDDGIGFHAEEAVKNASIGKSIGLLSMQERIRFLHGQLEIHSQLDQGTEICGRFPLHILEEMS